MLSLELDARRENTGGTAALCSTFMYTYYYALLLQSYAPLSICFSSMKQNSSVGKRRQS